MGVGVAEVPRVGVLGEAMAGRAVVEATAEAPRPLRTGGRLRCPLCEREAAEWRYTRYPPNPHYADQTGAVRRCPHPTCRRFFALLGD